jgi:hypothetical protein
MHIVTYFLTLQSNIKLYHWMTPSYPRHVASDKLLHELTEQIDKFVEVYIGKYGHPKLSGKDLSGSLTLATDQSVVALLNKTLTYLLTDINTYVKKEDVDLLTIRDEMVASINQAKYLFALK